MGVLLAGVCLRRSSGAIRLAPYRWILGRGVHQVNGQWGPCIPAFRTTLGAAVFFSCKPRDRVGFGSPSRQHARHQLEWNVHRITRSPVDRRRFYGAFGAGPAGQSGLLGEAHRARTWHGRFRDAIGRAARAALSRSSRVTLQDRFLSSAYTMFATARSVGWNCVWLCQSERPTFGTTESSERRLRWYDQMP